MTPVDDRLLCLARFAGAHGVRGEARLRAFTADPMNVGSYGPLTTEDGARRFRIVALRPLKTGFVLIRSPDIASREDAEALTGTSLFAPRSALPALEDPDEFYVEDLVGLNATTPDGVHIGMVKAVHNFGAGDMVEIAPAEGPTFMVPFTATAIPMVALGARVLMISEDALMSALNGGAQPATTQDV